MESDYSHHRLSVRVASRVAKLLKTYKISRKFQKYLELRSIALDYCTKSPLQNFTEKPHLLSFEDLSTMFCPRLPEK